MAMRGNYPLCFTVTLRRVTKTDEVDAFGNQLEVTADYPLQVFGWVLGGVELADKLGTNRVQYDATLYASTSQPVLPLDRIQLEQGGEWYEVDRPAENYENNPWFQPGLVVVYLKKVEG